MNKKKIILCTAFFTATLAVGVVAATARGGLLKFARSEDNALWRHYSAVAPTFDKGGIREYWVSCESHEHQFVAPSSSNIVNMGAPTQTFIDSLATSDDRVLTNSKSYSFEDATIIKQSDTTYHIFANGRNILRFVSTAGTVSVDFDTTNVTNGSKSLHFTVTGGNIEIFIDKYLYNQLGVNGVLFDILGSSTTDAFNVWNEGNANPDSGRGYINTDGGWFTMNYAKTKIGYWSGDWARLFKSNTGTTGNYEFYLDNIRPSNSVIEFENDALMPSNDYYFVKSYAGHTQSVSSEKAHSGSKSLKVALDSNGRGLCISDGIYSALPDEGLSFYLYSDTAFNAKIIKSASLEEDYLFNYWSTGEWKQYTIAKASMFKINNSDKYYTLFMNTSVAVTIYIDDIAPANSTIDFENNELHARIGMTKFNGSSETIYSVSSYDGVTFAGVSDERAFEGRNSYKVTTSAAHQMALKISDSLYNALLNDGLTFCMYSSQQFYYGINGGDDQLYSKNGEWVEITLAKANIDATAGRHYVFLPRAAVTIYIDNVRPAA